MGSQDVSPLRETTKDPFTGDCSCRQDGLTVIITACFTFATGVTIALIMQIYFGDPQVFHQGVVVTESLHCTRLGIDVLSQKGSSVDAAIVTALCLGIVNPHTSGIGGGGVMLIHNIRTNESDVIDFRETAPSGILEDSLKRDWEAQPGLLVGIPGMLRGMHQAHQLHGRMPWAKMMALVAGVAQNGFNVTHDLAQAITDVKDRNVSERFHETFFPGGQLLSPGTVMKRPDLAAIFKSVSSEGVSAFYSSNLTQEMIAEVHAYGGVLSEDDFSNYSVLVEKPLQGLYHDHLVFTPPPPHAGAALIVALNILQGFNISQNSSERLHLVTETLKIALAMASSLGDPIFNSTISDSVEMMLSKLKTSFLQQLINNSQDFPSDHYLPYYPLEDGAAASQVLVMGPDDFLVAVVSSLNRPFGSGIMTSSGVLLNSQMMDFSWPNKTTNHTVVNPANVIQPGKRPMSFLLPTIVRPAQGLCGTYLSLGGSSGDRALSGITQVLLNVLTFNKNLSHSLSLGRLHPDLESNILQVDSKFLPEGIQNLEARGYQVQKVDTLSLVHGARRNNDVIIGVKDPRSPDAAAMTIL
nr:glutathione hydrolase 7 isoform X2 [Geotrypetes seraphini]XP_033771038.1 glutathione hydrolase 7 isoform X2 [Geotrypetes seraphini]